jgi:hypothetical protein
MLALLIQVMELRRHAMLNYLQTVSKDRNIAALVLPWLFPGRPLYLVEENDDGECDYTVTETSDRTTSEVKLIAAVSSIPADQALSALRPRARYFPALLPRRVDASARTASVGLPLAALCPYVSTCSKPGFVCRMCVCSKSGCVHGASAEPVSLPSCDIFDDLMEYGFAVFFPTAPPVDSASAEDVQGTRYFKFLADFGISCGLPTLYYELLSVYSSLA